MSALALPESPSAFAKAQWSDVAPYFDDLAGWPLDGSNIQSWLQSWSTLEELLTEAAARAMIAYTINTGDSEKEADHLRFSTEVLPRVEERSVELARRLLESGHSTPALETTLTAGASRSVGGSDRASSASEASSSEGTKPMSTSPPTGK